MGIESAWSTTAATRRLLARRARARAPSRAICCIGSTAPGGEGRAGGARRQAGGPVPGGVGGHEGAAGGELTVSLRPGHRGGPSYRYRPFADPLRFPLL